MKTLLITKGTSGAFKLAYLAGSFVELEDKQADELVKQGFALYEKDALAQLSKLLGKATTLEQVRRLRRNYRDHKEAQKMILERALELGFVPRTKEEKEAAKAQQEGERVPMKAAEAVKVIATIDDIEELTPFLNDPRISVKEAAEARREELA